LNNQDYSIIFNAPGIYVLVGPFDEDIGDDDNRSVEKGAEEDDTKLIYIGEGDPVRDRLEKHYSNKDFWTWCIFFVGEDLNKAHIQYLEASLYKYAKEAKKAELNNENEPTPPNLSLAEKAVADGFLVEMLSIFPIVDLNVFQKGTPPKNCLYIDKKSRGVFARGYEIQEGFVVLKGSTAVLFGAPTIPRSLNNLRKKLADEGILITKEKCMEFIQDYTFRTPAKAAGVILGQPSARSSWEYQDGRALNGIQNQEIDDLGSYSDGS